ncbi:lipase family protein [Luteimonas sp. XNQY3]|nr:lipase family protein [Luteimonas sp. XNQY3]MCD9007033.1 lipase family protein [Luteimonas sp. XNQY3]
MFERIGTGDCTPPFPIYHDLVERLLAAHAAGHDGHDATVAHALATLAGHAYADTGTMASIMARLGLAGGTCVRVAQTVDAMYIHTTAYLLQSRCGRLAILCYRGTEPATLGNWIADADVGSEALRLAPGPAGLVRVHAGFHRNLRATRWAVLEQLRMARQGRSLLEPERAVAHPLQALYVTGHSLGGALAAVFALTLADAVDDIGACLRAVYTYGQPLCVGAPLPPQAETIAQRTWRHVLPLDPIPALPPAAWGAFAHFGHEYRPCNPGGAWQAARDPVAQMPTLKGLGRSLLSLAGAQRRRDPQRPAFAEHLPHRYIDALRPAGVLTEYAEATAPPAWPPQADA